MAPSATTKTSSLSSATTATTLVTRKTKSAATLMLCNALMFSIIASFVLSVDAMRCHQCNSHLDEDCIRLRLSTPDAQLDEQYLKACPVQPGVDSFCRKSVVTIEATGEHRIVRGCGWLHHARKDDGCISADNEGYLQTICSCSTDGCNAAPSIFSSRNIYIMLSLVVALFISSQTRRSF